MQQVILVCYTNTCHHGCTGRFKKHLRATQTPVKIDVEHASSNTCMLHPHLQSCMWIKKLLHATKTSAIIVIQDENKRPLNVKITY